MKKNVALTLSLFAYIIAYIPALIIYLKPDLAFGLTKVINIPLYMALGVSIFLIASLIAFYLRAYSVALVIAFIPLIILIVIGIIISVAFLFYKDIAAAFIKEKIKGMIVLPFATVGKATKEIATMPLKLFGK